MRLDVLTLRTGHIYMLFCAVCRVQYTYEAGTSKRSPIYLLVYIENGRFRRKLITSSFVLPSNVGGN